MTSKKDNAETRFGCTVVALIALVFICFAWGMANPSGWSPFVLFESTPTADSPQVAAEKADQRQAGWDYGHRLGREVSGHIDPKDWAMEPLAELHATEASVTSWREEWKDGFKNGLRAGLR